MEMMEGEREEGGADRMRRAAVSDAFALWGSLDADGRVVQGGRAARRLAVAMTFCSQRLSRGAIEDVR
jgi:hypothetical protein